MTQEEKQLLLKDICARLPYGLKYNYGGNDGCDYIMDRASLIAVDDAFPLEDIKPYLRPMSSMNSKEWVEYCDASLEDEKSWILTEKEYKFTPVTHREEFLNAHHFDYRGLIEKGLALEAQADMYKTE